MRQFVDCGGNTWLIQLNVDTIKRVRDLIKVDLTDVAAGDPPLIVRLGTDVILLCDVLFAVCAAQASKAGVTDEEFGRAMGGDALLAGSTALMEELTDFFQKLGRREVATMIRTHQRLVTTAVSAVESRLAAVDVERMVLDEIAKSLGGRLSGNVPASSV